MDAAIREWEPERASEWLRRVLSEVSVGEFAPMFSAHSDLILLVQGKHRKNMRLRFPTVETKPFRSNPRSQRNRGSVRGHNHP